MLFRRNGIVRALFVSGLAAVLIPLTTVPVAALGAPAPIKTTTSDKLPALSSDKTKRPTPDIPTGDFTNPPGPNSAINIAAANEPGDHFKAGVSKVVDHTANSDIYDNGDGTKTSVIYMQDANTKDAKGNWVKIDNSLTNDNQGHIHNGVNPLGVNLGATTGNGNIAQLTAGSASFGFNASGITSGIAGQIDNSKDSVTYPKALGGADLSYFVAGSQLKERITLNSAPNSPPVYQFPISTSLVTPRVNGDASISLVDANNKEAFHVSQGTATDSSQHPDGPGSISPVSVTLSPDGHSLIVTPNANWLKTATFPVFIDPTVQLGQDYGQFDESIDTFANSFDPTNNQNWLFDDNPYYTDYAGKNAGGMQLTTYMYFRTSSLSNLHITNAMLNLDQIGSGDGSSPLCVYPASQSWNDDTLTWNNKANHYGDCNVPTDQNKVRVAFNPGMNSMDITSWVTQWTSGSLANNGMAMDTGGATTWYRMASLDNRDGGVLSASPTISVTYTDLTPASTNSPATGTSVLTATPNLVANAGSSDIGSTLSYWYRVSDTADPESGEIINSGWLPNATSWQVPTGSLKDGVTYSWKVGVSAAPSAPYPTVYWSNIASFKVNMRLGQQSVSPMDTEGPVTVNLATGNATTSFASKQLTTAGGNLGVDYTYNSQAEQTFGLTGSYYDGCGSDGTYPAKPYIVRTDPVIDFSWGNGSPGPSIQADHWCAKWNGYITVPRDNTYQFETVHDDGVAIGINNQTVNNNWSDGSVTSPAWGSQDDTYGFTGSTTLPIEIDYYDNTGGADLQLWVQAPGISPMIVPSTWLTTTPSPLSQGWSLSAGDQNQSLLYSQAAFVNGGMVLYSPDGVAYEYEQVTSGSTTSGFTPPANDSAIVRSNGDGTYLVQGRDSKLYTFNSLGALTSVQTVNDDKNPAGAVYVYNPGADTARVSAIIDPTSDITNNRAINLKYSGGAYGASDCANAPAGLGFDAQAPSGMLCRIDYWDGTSTYLYYVGGLLARIQEPGNSTAGYPVTDFAYGYNSSTQSTYLVSIRNPLQNDWLAAGGSDSSADRTNIGYDTAGRVTSVTLASTTGTLGDSNMQSHSYSYGPATNEARVTVAGISPTQSDGGHWYGDYQWDDSGRTINSTDATGATTVNTWDSADQQTSSIQDARQIGASLPNSNLAKETTNIYNVDEQLTDTYGPAPSYCFNQTTLLPTGYCAGPSVPHTATTYDGNFSGGNNGLAAAYWATGNLSGASKYHAYINGNGGNDVDGGGWLTGVSGQLGTPTPTTWSGRLTGRILLSATGNYSFNGSYGTVARIYVDNNLVYDTWPSDVPVSSTFSNTTLNSSHTIRVEDQFTQGGANPGLVWTTPSNGTQAAIPGSVLTPDYGLVTQTTADDSTGGSPASVDATTYSNPAYGIVSGTTQDPSVLALTTSSTSESPGTGYLRQTTKTLPGGNTTTYIFYATPGSSYGNAVSNANTTSESINNPCTGTAAGEQGGLLAESDSPAPATGSGVATDFVYNADGQVVASWNRGDSVYTCTTYDSRGRISTKTIPAYNGVTGDSISYNYSVGGSPLTMSMTDNSGTITQTVDLLGQVTAYTDVWGRNTTYDYDQAGRQYESDAPGDSRSTTFDSSGRAVTQNMGYDNTQLNPVASVPSTGYDAASELTHVDYPSGSGNNGNGTSVDIGYDIYGNKASINYKQGATSLGSDTDTFSQQGRVVSETIGGIANSSSFAYDGAGRLTSGTVNGNTYSYGFGTTSGCTNNNAGKNDDRTSFTLNGGTASTYCYDSADRLTSSTDPNYSGTISYDTHGNTTQLAGSTMTYSDDNEHVSTVNGGTTVTYKRDATGRIVERDTSTTSAGIVAKGQTTNNNGSGSTSLALAKPSTAVIGDVLLAHVAVKGGSGVTISTPSGWTLVNSAYSGTNVRSSVYSHVVASGDPSSWTFTLSSSKSAAGGIGDYSGVSTTSPVNASTYHTSGSSGTWHVASGVTTTTANTMDVIVSGINACTTVTPASGQTQLWSQCASTAAQSYSTEALQPAAGTTPDVNNISSGNGWDATQMVALTPAGSGTTTTALRYDYSNGSDSMSNTADTSGNVIDKSVGLLGGASRIVHYGTGGAQTYTWTYSNLHGDTLFTADQTGVKTGGTYLYDPFGTAVSTVPDDLTGNFDYGYLGADQRGTEHEGSLDIIEMGARQYAPGLGRFLSVDPLSGGSANDYDYVDQDPINAVDLAGTAKKIPRNTIPTLHVKISQLKSKEVFVQITVGEWNRSGVLKWTIEPPGGRAVENDAYLGTNGITKPFTFACRWGWWVAKVAVQASGHTVETATAKTLVSCNNSERIFNDLDAQQAPGWNNVVNVSGWGWLSDAFEFA